MVLFERANGFCQIAICQLMSLLIYFCLSSFWPGTSVWKMVHANLNFYTDLVLSKENKDLSSSPWKYEFSFEICRLLSSWCIVSIFIGLICINRPASALFSVATHLLAQKKDVRQRQNLGLGKESWKMHLLQKI